jgi:hypothetical protein
VFDKNEFKVEFSCKMQDQGQADQVKQVLHELTGVTLLDLNVSNNQVLLEMSVQTKLGLDQIQRRIESQTGCETVLKGFGDKMAAVAELRISPLIQSPSNRISTDEVLGVTRMTQLPGSKCFVDAFIDNLPKSQQSIGLNMHSYGNLSDVNLTSIGSIHIPIDGIDCL